MVPFYGLLSMIIPNRTISKRDERNRFMYTTNASHLQALNTIELSMNIFSHNHSR